MVGAQASAITAGALVPLLDGFHSTNGTAVNAALRAAVRCGSVLHTPAAAGQATCNIGRVAPGTYLLMVQLKSGVVLLSSTMVAVQLLVAEVQPNQGSIAGGTHLQINGARRRRAETEREACAWCCAVPPGLHSADRRRPPAAPAGRGFSADAASNVVVLRVPPSTTFPQGAVLCDVTAASATALTCTSRGHLAANATAEDPLADGVQPDPTDARCAAPAARPSPAGGSAACRALAAH